MAEYGNGQPDSRFLSRETLLLAVAFLLPAMIPGLFGWLYGLLPVPVFCCLVLSRPGNGLLTLRNGMLLALAPVLIFQQALPTLLFSFTFVPLGYSLYSSGQTKKKVFAAAIAGTVTLTVTWILFWTAAGIIKGINPYTQLVQASALWLEQTHNFYKELIGQQPEALHLLEQRMVGLKNLVPRILPGLLGCLVILTVVTGLAIGNSILLRLLPSKAPWPPFTGWQIPEKFVWVAIGSLGAGLIGEGGIRDAGFCIGLTCSLIYFFQGLAILVHLLEKWNIPGYFRILIYMVVVVQTFGFIMLTMLGLADVWINFRRLPQQDQQPNN